MGLPIALPLFAWRQRQSRVRIMTTEGERKRGLALGADKYLFLPIEPQDLLREIENCLRDPPKD